MSGAVAPAAITRKLNPSERINVDSSDDRPGHGSTDGCQTVTPQQADRTGSMVATIASARSAFLISPELRWVGIPASANRMAGMLNAPTTGLSVSPGKVKATTDGG